MNKPIRLKLDANSVGAILKQEDGHGVDPSVCYYSKNFLKQQLNYRTIGKETFALLMALQNFKLYFVDSAAPFHVYTGNNRTI